MKPVVLIVEHQMETSSLMRTALERHGYSVMGVRDAESAFSELSRVCVDLVVCACEADRFNGSSLFRMTRRMLDVPFVMVGARADGMKASVNEGEGGLRRLLAPLRVEDDLVPLVRELLHRDTARGARRQGVERLTGRSFAVRRLRHRLRRIARTPVSVLIVGETGTGKEEAARALHEESGRDGFFAVSATELAETLLESELFGHERGAFTGAVTSRRGLFEMARGGTLLLDEIGDAGRTLQAKLLRVLETHEVRPLGGESMRPLDVRLIFATHRDLAQRSKEGFFRQDLLYRINQATLALPPLRERSEDIEPIAQQLMSGIREEMKTPMPQVGATFWKALRGHVWRGNVRELRSVLQHVLLWWDGHSPLERPDFFEALIAGNPSIRPDHLALGQRMLDAYRTSRGNQEGARRLLGLSRAEWRHRWCLIGLDDLGRRRVAAVQPQEE